MSRDSEAEQWEAQVPTVRPLGPATPEELLALVELERHIHGASAHYDDAPWRLENFARPLPGKAELSLVATMSDGPVGFLIASSSLEGVHVHRLAIDPEHWGTGIAAQLLARLLARSAGRVTINCDPQNAPALALYERAGFRVTETTTAGKLLLSTDDLVPATNLRVWYVFTSTGMRSGHAAHLPGLIDALARISRCSAVQYGDPADLPTLRLTLGWARAFARLLARARRERVDVVFVRIHWKLAALFWLAGRLGGGWRVALWSSGGLGFLPDAPLSLSQRAGRLIRRLVLRRALDAVVTGPPRVLEEYAERYGLNRDRLLLASNDIDINRWRASADAEPELASLPIVQKWLKAPHRFLYVHGLDMIRGADRLPELLSGLRQELSDAELLVVGDGPLRVRLAGEPLLLAGRAPNNAVAWVMSQAHCLLLPSRQEGFPRVLLEAMALELPCVTFDVGGCSDVLGEMSHKYVASDGDLDQMVALAVASVSMRTSEGSGRELIQRAQTFDTTPAAAALVATLRSLRVQGAAPAAWLSRSLWRPVFPERKA